MFRVWVKIWKNNHLEQDTTIVDETKDTRTHKVFHALEEACTRFDLGHPIWLESNIKEFKRHAKVRFYQDSFVEEIPFDYMEFHVIEEDI